MCAEDRSTVESREDESRAQDLDVSVWQDSVFRGETECECIGVK